MNTEYKDKYLKYKKKYTELKIQMGGMASGNRRCNKLFQKHTSGEFEDITRFRELYKGELTSLFAACEKNKYESFRKNKLAEIFKNKLDLLLTNYKNDQKIRWEKQFTREKNEYQDFGETTDLYVHKVDSSAGEILDQNKFTKLINYYLREIEIFLSAEEYKTYIENKIKEIKQTMNDKKTAGTAVGTVAGTVGTARTPLSTAEQRRMDRAAKYSSTTYGPHGTVRSHTAVTTA